MGMCINCGYIAPSDMPDHKRPHHKLCEWNREAMRTDVETKKKHTSEIAKTIQKRYERDPRKYKWVKHVVGNEKEVCKRWAQNKEIGVMCRSNCRYRHPSHPPARTRPTTEPPPSPQPANRFLPCFAYKNQVVTGDDSTRTSRAESEMDDMEDDQ